MYWTGRNEFNSKIQRLMKETQFTDDVFKNYFQSVKEGSEELDRLNEKLSKAEFWAGISVGILISIVGFGLWFYFSHH